MAGKTALLASLLHAIFNLFRSYVLLRQWGQVYTACDKCKQVLKVWHMLADKLNLDLEVFLYCQLTAG